jgi:GTP cyclohydrolase I
MNETLISPAITQFPSPIKEEKPFVDKEEQIAYIEQRVREIMEALGLDLTQCDLDKTPLRVARSYVLELFSGLDYDNFPDITYFEERALNSKFGSDPVEVMVRDITLTSTCEHHLMPFFGKAHVAYIPTTKIVGLSKIHRLVHYFAARPQLQERLTSQIADCLSLILDTPDVAVQIVARHSCVCVRGVRDESSETITSLLMGRFKETNPFIISA